jgi:DNA-directed RNA polymerase delta subunit
MSKKKEWLFKEFWDAVEKFNELAETGRYSSLSEIYKKLAEDFKCTEGRCSVRFQLIE